MGRGARNGAGSRVGQAIYIINCVGKANVNRQALIEAIAAMEAHSASTANDRALNRAIDVALRALREELAQAQAEPADPKRRQLAVLVADLSGFTTFSERMDAERLRDAINAMWGELDAVIRAWGGEIDQHAGDSLMALFGLVHPRPSDAMRALHAALAMQQELLIFNERVQQAADDSRESAWAGEWPGPRMRIGVHSGPVYFARSPGAAAAPAGRPAAVGDTIAVARRLEKAAPAGAVLTSETVRQLAAGRFVYAPLPADHTVLVVGERLPQMGYTPGTVAGQITRRVGRIGLISRLEVALQTAADSRTPQLVTIIGAPGAGKSRLAYEFGNRARILGISTILRAGTLGSARDFPYSLVRDLLLRRFAIRPQHSAKLIEWKLRRGFAELDSTVDGGVNGRPDLSSQAITLLEKLLDVRTAAAVPVDEALAVFTPLLQSITTASPAIAILEGLNRADPQSLELVEQLVRAGEAGPLLILGLATVAPATDPVIALPWLGKEEDIFSPMERLDLQPLSAVDSRLMATEILQPLTAPSMRLLDLVVVESGGNPLYIETFIQWLIDRGVITVGDRWRVDMARVEESHLPAGLGPLIAARLAELPEEERQVLQTASVFGPLCWDIALLEMEPAIGLDAAQLEATLNSLELKEYLAADDVYNFPSSQAYSFRRDSVREAAYAGLSAEERCRLHLGAARWLIANRRSARFSSWISIDAMIAQHFAAAGDDAQAGAWRGQIDAPAHAF